MVRRSVFMVAAGLLLAGCGSAPHDAVRDVPLGSRLSELDRYYPRGAGSEGEVDGWVVVEKGTGRVRQSGSYDSWKATPEERDRSSGEIRFFHHGSTSSDVNSLVYVDGRLQEKDWGFLAGLGLDPFLELRLLHVAQLRI